MTVLTFYLFDHLLIIAIQIDLNIGSDINVRSSNESNYLIAVITMRQRQKIFLYLNILD